MQSIQELQNKVNSLEKENQYLKSLLTSAGIPYKSFSNTENDSLYDPDQGARIIHKEITTDDANRFFGMF